MSAVQRCRTAALGGHVLARDQTGVTFKWKDYRAEGSARYKTMTLAPHEFIRRFLLHVPPTGFHRIRHYGFLANGNRSRNIALARRLLDMPTPEPDDDAGDDAEVPALPPPCPERGGRMIIIESFEPGHRPRAPPIALPEHRS